MPVRTVPGRIVPCLLALATTIGAADAATCRPRDLTGIWVGHATVQKDLYCLIEVRKDGTIPQSSCFNPKSLKSAATLDGSLSLGRDCKVQGAFTFKSTDPAITTPATFKGKLKTETGIMSGNFVIFGEGEAYRFIRQLD